MLLCPVSSISERISVRFFPLSSERRDIKSRAISKEAKSDWVEHKWIETSEESLGQRLTSVVEKLEDAQKSINVLQEAHQTTLKNTESTDTAMDQLQKTVQMSNRMMATLSATVSALAKAYQGLKSSDTTTETK